MCSKMFQGVLNVGTVCMPPARLRENKIAWFALWQFVKLASNRWSHRLGSAPASYVLDYIRYLLIVVVARV